MIPLVADLLLATADLLLPSNLEESAAVILFLDMTAVGTLGCRGKLNFLGAAPLLLLFITAETAALATASELLSNLESSSLKWAFLSAVFVEDVFAVVVVVALMLRDLRSGDWSIFLVEALGLLS